MENRLNWILFLTIVWASGSLQYSCKYSKECSCMNIPPEGYLIDCPMETPTMSVEVKSKSSGSVNCYQMAEWSDLKINSATEVEDVSAFFFKQCPLPDSNLHDITQRIGVQPTNRLSFESYKNLSSTLERRHLSDFPKIKELSLSSNGLTNLPADLLMDLPELALLEIRENNVILPPNFFNAVPKLQRLELGNNKLTSIEPMLFRSLERLGFLALWGNELTHIDNDTFEGLVALSTLEISKNKLITLDRNSLRPLGNLSTLHMSANYFSSLPQDLLSKNLNLTIFHLNYNRGNLTTLPSRFLSNLPKLTDVYLAHDKLEVLPEDIFWGSSLLKNINLGGNLLSTLPVNIFNESKNLIHIDLSSNKLSNLPDRIFQALTKLEKLDLQRNTFTSISNDLFYGLTGLKELNMEYNELKSIAEGSFSHLESLELAKLSHNQLTLKGDELLPADFGNQSPFFYCKKLRELELGFNNITAILEDWTFILYNLRKLDLKYNQISYLAATDFQFISPEIDVDITHNNISQINLDGAEIIATSQDPSENLRTKKVRIYVEENPIICDCNLYPFLRYLHGNMHPDVQKMFHIIPGSLECAGPEWMQHELVFALRPEALQCIFPDCPEKCTCLFRRSDNTVIANCSNSGLSIAPERILHETGNVELDLTGNFLTKVPFIDQSGYGDITKLFLSHNNISSISSDNIPLTLEVLELHGNNLTRLDGMVLERFKKSQSLKDITLHGNPWICDCDARDFLNFVQLKFKKIPHLLNVTCGNNIRPFLNMTVTDLCPVATGMIVGVSLGIAVLGLLIGMLAALYYKYQAEIKVWLYAHQMCLWFVTEEELDKDKLYDAFISYSHKDEDFVVNKLVSQLEEGQPRFKLCLHYRDWLAGEWIPTQIAKSVEDSRRTIVVLSPNFLESIWGRMEFRAAHSQALSEGRARVIVILYGDVGPTENLDPELKAYLSMNTYVEWGDPWFWDKLRYALPHPPKVKQNNAKKIFETHQHHIRINGDKNGLINPPGVPTTPPAVTTPPADTLKTFTSNGSLNQGVLITNCLSNGMADLKALDMKINRTAKENNDHDNNMINGQCTPV